MRRSTLDFVFRNDFPEVTFKLRPEGRVEIREEN